MPNMTASPMEELRAATHSSHQRLERRLDIKQSFSDPQNYRVYLEKMWGFCAVVERYLDMPALGKTLPDHQSRHKLPLLERDLVTLGLESTSVRALPKCSGLPEC